MEGILEAVFSAMDALLPFAFAEAGFMKRALLALMLIAPAAAAVGVPLVQFRMSFFSDAIGHSAFTGVALGVVLGVSPTWTMAAFAACWSPVAIVSGQGADRPFHGHGHRRLLLHGHRPGVAIIIRQKG
jgi:zinc transport system permease protein